MSTKAIREALALARARKGFGDTEEEMLADKAAMEEIEAIERAAPLVYEVYAGKHKMDVESIYARRAAFEIMESIAKDAP